MQLGYKCDKYCEDSILIYIDHVQSNLILSLSLKPVLNLNTKLYKLILNNSIIYDLIYSYSTYIIYDIFNGFL